MNVKFNCPSCHIEVNGFKEFIYGTEYCVCPICNGVHSFDGISVLNRTTNERFGNISVETQMYEPTKIDKYGREYDMQPRRKR